MGKELKHLSIAQVIALACKDGMSEGRNRASAESEREREARELRDKARRSWQGK